MNCKNPTSKQQQHCSSVDEWCVIHIVTYVTTTTNNSWKANNDPWNLYSAPCLLFNTANAPNALFYVFCSTPPSAACRSSRSSRSTNRGLCIGKQGWNFANDLLFKSVHSIHMDVFVVADQQARNRWPMMMMWEIYSIGEVLWIVDDDDVCQDNGHKLIFHLCSNRRRSLFDRQKYKTRMLLPSPRHSMLIIHFSVHHRVVSVDMVEEEEEYILTRQGC